MCENENRIMINGYEAITLARLKRFLVEQHQEYRYATFYAEDILRKISDIESSNELGIDEMIEIEKKPPEKKPEKKEENA